MGETDPYASGDRGHGRGGTVDAFLGLGSNVGARRAHLRDALLRLRELGELSGVSTVYETAPMGFQDQRRFLNLVVRLRTRLGPGELLDRVLEIEAERGRERSFRNAPRTLDIDILLYGDEVVDRAGLRVPHPRMHERPFVLVPLLELDPDVEDPRTGERFAGMAAAALSRTGMERVTTGEELLRAHDDG